MVDHLPLTAAERPKPHLPALTLLVGRITTIKLAYWGGLTVFELGLPHVTSRPIAERLPVTYAAAALATLLAVVWAAWAARANDRRIGRLVRSIPTVGVAFVAAAVVASPASIPLLLVELQRSLEGCAPQTTCHAEAIGLWLAVVAAGTLLIPAVFAVAMRGEQAPRPATQANAR